MDLQVDGQIMLDEGEMPLDPHVLGDILSAFGRVRLLPWLLKGGSRALLSTLEELSIPEGFIGLIGVRSTWARLGLISPFTVADPGFTGTLTLEVFNSNKRSLLLRPTDKIWNLTLVAAPFEPLYTGRYQKQHGITLPKALT